MATHWLRDLAQASTGDFDVTEAVDARLSAVAVEARACSVAAFDLLRLLAPKISRFVYRFRSWDLAPFDLDDVAQEAYLVYLDTLRRWTPRCVAGRPAGYLYYFLKVFPLWLGNRVRGWRRPARPPVVRHIQPAEHLDDGSVVTDFCHRLSHEDATLLRLRIIRGLSIPRAAQTMGIARRTAYRRWHRIRKIGEEYLREAG